MASGRQKCQQFSSVGTLPASLRSWFYYCCICEVCCVHNLRKAATCWNTLIYIKILEGLTSRNRCGLREKSEIRLRVRNGLDLSTFSTHKTWGDIKEPYCQVGESCIPQVFLWKSAPSQQVTKQWNKPYSYSVCQWHLFLWTQIKFRWPWQFEEVDTCKQGEDSWLIHVG